MTSSSKGNPGLSVRSFHYHCTRASLRFEKRLNFSINFRKTSIFHRSFSNEVKPYTIHYKHFWGRDMVWPLQLSLEGMPNACRLFCKAAGRYGSGLWYWNVVIFSAVLLSVFLNYWDQQNWRLEFLYFVQYALFFSIHLTSPPPPLLHSSYVYAGVMGCGAAEATGLGFVCFAVINPRVLSANRVYFDFS